jgi:large subunit ribosomal protein L15
MALSLHNIQPYKNSKRPRKRIGRGGKRGTTSGRGTKGQKARSGVSGLQRKGLRQLMERTHKVHGFQSIYKKPAIVSLAVLNKKFISGDLVTPEKLLEKKIVGTTRPAVKILSNGEIKIKIKVTGCQVSKDAKAKIEKAGGEVIIIPKEKPVEKPVKVSAK